MPGSRPEHLEGMLWTAFPFPEPCCFCFVCLGFFSGLGNSFPDRFRIYLPCNQAERGKSMEQTKNLCARIPTPLFRRFKMCLAIKGLNTQECMNQLIEQAVSQWEWEMAPAEEPCAENQNRPSAEQMEKQ